MQVGVEQVKHSATWGGAKSSPTPTGNKVGDSPSRKRSNARRAAQFLLCFGLAMMFTINASAAHRNDRGRFASQSYRISRHLSPELFDMVAQSDPSKVVDVVVQYRNGFGGGNRNQAESRGAKYKRGLNVIKSAQLSIPLSKVEDLADDPDVKYITLDRKVKMFVDDVTGAVSADLAWSYGYDGTGVGIAVIDSGVKSHTDLNSWGISNSRVVYSESFVPGDTSTVDAYGHGTHVAGIAAGNGYLSQTGYKFDYQGLAPGAKIVNLRVLDANGCGSDSNVIAAIDRAIQLKGQYNIRVINLSLGRTVYESFTQDPLDQAVEKAWQAGIVVVVAAGNSGRDNSMGTNGYGTIGAPGNDPYVITVGATSTNGTPTWIDDKIATYSSKGPTLIDHVVKPDLIAPGDKVVSLRAANTTLVNGNPSMNVYPCAAPGCTTGTPQYFRLSGTSMATPVVSGSVALMLQKDPSLTPDIVKARLMKTANKLMPLLSTAFDSLGRKYSNQYDLFTYGAGYLNIAAALKNTDRGNGVAISPRAVFDPNTGRVYLDKTWNASGQSLLWGNSILWGDSVLWADSVLWGDSIMWGNSALLTSSSTSSGLLGGLTNTLTGSLNTLSTSAMSVLWGDSVIWGDSSNSAFSVLWGESVMWGNYTDQNNAFSEGDPGDCSVDDVTGEVVCQ
jgi:serine protease AprX